MLTEIVNHLWQSTLVATAIAALAATLRDDGAHVALLALVGGLGEVPRAVLVC